MMKDKLNELRPVRIKMPKADRPQMDSSVSDLAPLAASKSNEANLDRLRQQVTAALRKRSKKHA